MRQTVKVSEFRKHIARRLAELPKGSIVLIKHGDPITVVTLPPKPRCGAPGKARSRSRRPS